MHNKAFFNTLLALCFLVFTLTSICQTKQKSEKPAIDLLKLGNQLQFSDPDSSILILNNALTLALESTDSLTAITILSKLVVINGNLGRYYKSYKNLIQKIQLTKELNFQAELIEAYSVLGLHYGYLKRKDEALFYMDKAQKLAEYQYKNNKESQDILYYPYFAKASFYGEIGAFDQSQIYLDSTYMVGDPDVRKGMSVNLPIKQAVILIAKKDYRKAIDLLIELIPLASKNYPSTLIILHKNLGDAYMGINKPNRSIEEYNKAIEYSDHFNRHQDYSVLIYDKLSEVYEQIGDHQAALSTFRRGQEVDFRIFDSRSENNVHLLEVQDQLLRYEEQQLKLEREQKLTQLENEEKLMRLQQWSLLGGICLMSLIGYLTYKSQKQKQESQHELNKELRDKIEKEAEYTTKIEEKNKQFLAFSSIMTHDLKSPLRTIQSFSSLILRKAEKDNISPDIIKNLGYISNSAFRMSKLVDDLLVYSRVEIDKVQLTNIRLNDLINEIFSSLQYDIERQNVISDIGILPEVLGDESILKTVFQNIIANGIKYQPRDKSNHIPKITIWADSKNDSHDIFIQDNGIGISEDYVDKLFTPFNRYHSTSEYEGTGLGLSICKGIMKKHKGNIILHHTSTNGSTFKIQFSKQKLNDQLS